MSGASEDVRRTLAGLLLLACAYFLGAAISRVSGDVVNDGKVGMQNLIRLAVYNSEPMPLRSIGLPKDQSYPLETIFQIQESAVLLGGKDKTERVRQLYEQAVVLRGAAFDGLVLAVLCLFGSCAGKHETARLPCLWIGWVFSIGIVLFGSVSIAHFLRNPNFSDPPFLEVTLIILGLVGFYALYRGAPRRPYGTGLLLSMLLATIAVFGWWWTEVLYDRQVIYSFYAGSLHLLSLIH